MTPLQSQLFEMMKVFDAFCKEHELQYCLAWGTLLGAKRHKGFIPWDDDVDLAMTRSSFEKLKQLAVDGKLPEGLVFEDSYFTKGCAIPKIRDKRTGLVDNSNGVGIFLDIYPMDNYSSFSASLFKLVRAGLIIRDRRKRIGNKALRLCYTFMSIFPYLIFAMVKKLYMHLPPAKTGVYVSTAPVTNPEFFFFQNEMYPFGTEEFEGMNLPVPHDVEAVLRLLYGGWETPVQTGNTHFKKED